MSDRGYGFERSVSGHMTSQDHEEMVAHDAINYYRLFWRVDGSEPYCCIGVAPTLAEAWALLDSLPADAVTIILPPGIPADNILLALIAQHGHDAGQASEMRRDDRDVVRMLLEGDPIAADGLNDRQDLANYRLSSGEQFDLLTLRIQLERRSRKPLN